jgi:hypothetical protein
MSDANEPGAAVQAIFSSLIDRIKSSRPINTNKQPTELGFVYSGLVLGMMVDPSDYAAPWSPAGGSSMQDAIDKGAAPAKAPAAAPAAAGGAAAADAAPAQPNAHYLRAMDAAFKTAMLVDRMIMVTSDDSYLEYPSPRRLSNAYEAIVKGMQPQPPPPMAPDVAARLEAARKILYVPDDDGDLLLKSKLYKAYEKNTKAYAQAVSDYAAAEADASTDPAKAQVWPVTSKALREAVDDAWDTLKGEGADKVEAAINDIESVGVSIEEEMVAKARKSFDIWNLGLAGAVPEDVPYAYCSPTAWSDPDDDSDGWTTITVTRNSSGTYVDKERGASNTYAKNTSSSHTTTSASGSYFGFGASAGYHTGSAHEDDKTTTKRTALDVFKNTASNLTISLEYGMVDIIRPWLLGDLFYMKNWYIIGNKKNSISDGTVAGQALKEDPLLPMMAMQFLVVRNVKISTKQWGSDGHTLQTMFGNGGGAWDQSSSGFNASASYGFGPISLKASVSHDQAKEGVSRYGNYSSADRQDSEASFDGETLEIKGAQIVAWLSTIVPATPPLDDPMLGQTAAAPAAAAPATAAPAAAAPAAAPQPALTH